MSSQSNRFVWKPKEVKIVKSPPPVEESKFAWKPGDVTVTPPVKDGGAVFTIDKDINKVFDFYRNVADEARKKEEEKIDEIASKTP